MRLRLAVKEWVLDRLRVRLGLIGPAGHLGLVHTQDWSGLATRGLPGEGGGGRGEGWGWGWEWGWEWGASTFFVTEVSNLGFSRTLPEWVRRLLL